MGFVGLYRGWGLVLLASMKGLSKVSTGYSIRKQMKLSLRSLSSNSKNGHWPNIMFST